MRVFIAGSTSNLSNQRKDDLLKIIQVFTKNKVKVMDSWLIDTVKGIKKKMSVKQLFNYNLKLLKKSDIVVIDPSVGSLGVGLYFSEALANRKYVLVIYREDELKEEISAAITGSSSSLMTLQHYNSHNLEKIVQTFLDNLSLDSLQKFNFMANKQIIDWIKRGAEEENKSKSEFLRDVIVNKLIKS